MRRYTSKKYTYTPTQGVKSDFENLLQKFTETGTVRFANFAEIWRDMNFSAYCAGRQTLREAREFIEECLKIATQFWLPPSSFQVRAGALYLLYGLYNYQIATPKTKLGSMVLEEISDDDFTTGQSVEQKLNLMRMRSRNNLLKEIRLTPENWKSVLEFQSLAREQQHLDIDYVFQKLKLDRAFAFVATTHEHNPYDYRDDIEGKTMPDSLKDEESLLTELYSSQVLNQLAAVHDQYHKMKVALAGDDYNDEPDTSLNIINDDLIQNIYRTLQSHREKMTPHPAVIHKNASQDTSEDDQALDTNYSVKKALKNKAFSAYVDSGPSRGLGRGIGRGGRGRGRARGRIGRPRDQKIQDSVVNLQDPKINVCGRIRGRAPHIDIFGKAEEKVIGPSVPASLGNVGMLGIDHLLGMEEKEEKPEIKKQNRKQKKKESKKSRKTSKSDIETDSEEEEEAEPQKKTRRKKTDKKASDVEGAIPRKRVRKKTKSDIEEEGATQKKRSRKKSGSKTEMEKKTEKKKMKSVFDSDNENGTDTEQPDTEEPVLKVKVDIDGKDELILVKRETAVTSDEEWMDVEDDAEHSEEEDPIPSAKKSPGKGLKERTSSAKKSPAKSTKKSPVKSTKKQNKKGSSKTIEEAESQVESMKLPTKVAETPTKRSLRSNMDDVSDTSPVKTPRRTARMSVVNSDIEELKKFKTKGEIDIVIEENVGVELKRKSNEKSVGKSANEQSETSVSGKKKTKGKKSSAEDSVGHSESLGKQTPESGKKTSQSKISLEKSGSLGGKLLADAGSRLKTTARKSGPSAQERLNMKIAQRMKDKRKSQNVDSE